MDILISALSTIFVLGVLIAIHEWGHFICAKLSGVNVEKFSIGFGPELLKFHKNGTDYTISAIPLGGFVKMGGETMDEREGELKPDDFLAQSRFSRFMIVFAGPLMNYILAFVLLVFVFLVGAPTLTSTIGDILKDSPAHTNGLLAGDKIVQMNEIPIETWSDMTEFIGASDGEEIRFLIEREGEIIPFTFAAERVERKDIFGDLHTTFQIGIASAGDVIYEKLGFIGAVKGAGEYLVKLTGLTLKSIYRLVTGRLSLKVMSGPLGIVDMAAKTAQQGIVPLLQLTAYLSVFLAVFNLLPFPALDGGHLLFLFLEVLFNKPVKYHIQEKFTQVGFMLLLTLMVVVLYNDMDRFGWFDKIKSLFFQ